MTNTETTIQAAIRKFEALIRAQQERAEAIKQAGDFVDYAELDRLIIGVCGGDGIGPVITNESARVLKHLLADEVAGSVKSGGGAINMADVILLRRYILRMIDHFEP